MPMTKTCCLCSQIAGESANDLIAGMLPGEPYVRRVMLESDSFAAIPSLGPLASGHTLLCPKKHVTSFARLEPGLHGEYRTVREELRRALSRLYDPRVHLFEHGMAAAGGRVVCTTDHAHVHFLPLPGPFAGDDIERLPWMEFDGSPGELARLAAGREYVMYERPGGPCRLLVGAGGGFESQFMRRLLARAHGRGERWDWRAHPEPRAADETWRRFAL